MTIGEALLDQRALAGIGNVYRSEVIWMDRVDPFARVGRLDDGTLARIVETARRLLVENSDPAHGPARTTTAAVGRAAGGERLWVYRRAGRPCRRCATAIRSARLGSELPRTVYWCPRCQGAMA
jgi:endonuclease VIII